MNPRTLLALLSCAALFACIPETVEPQQEDEDEEADTDTADTDTADTGEGDTSVELDNEHDGYLGSLAPEECDQRGLYSPYDEEKGWWSATGMSANDRDVVIDSVRYEILDERDGEVAAAADCALIDHRVAVYIGGAAPSDSPTMLFETVVTDLVADPEQDSQVVVVDMPPLTLKAGEYLYVLVEQEVNEQGERICNRICGAPKAGDHSYISGSDSAPYPWQSVTSFGHPNAGFGIWAHIEDEG